MNARELTDQIAAKLAAEVRRNGDIIPYIAEDGVYKTDMRQKNLSWWTNGFWAGLLWQMYHAVGVAEFKATAEKTEGWLDEAMADFTGLHHDVGFMWMLSAVADYRLTGNEKSRIRAMHAATLLAGRYNPNGRFLRAWNGDKTGWMIVDCLMNLSLLYWASDETGDPRYAEIAQNHADTALRVLLRPDGSCNHIAVLDPVTGELTGAPAGQGYAPGSSWSRGQSWAVYGFALSAKHTGEARYLEAAKRSAHYFIANAATHNWEPLVDFLAPESPELLDMSAGVIAACGLLELEKQVSVYEKKLYHDAAEHLLSAIAKKHLDLAPETDGIVLDSTADYHKDIHTRMIYADYYFVEGLLRLQGKEFFAW